MKQYTLPSDFVSFDEDKPAPVYLLPYTADQGSLKTKVTLQYHLFTFLLKGTKRVYYPGRNTKITDRQFVLLSSGNCLMTEKTNGESDQYKSILLFFDNTILTDFFSRQPLVLKGSKREEPFIVFEKDYFLDHFVTSLDIMLGAGRKIPLAMQRVKLEELLLYLSDKYPGYIASLNNNISTQEADAAINSVIRANMENNITVEELAFLCHMSISTFKRRFAKLYGTSPNKWLLQKRMELAAGMLQSGTLNVSDIYHRIGYENMSSFIQTFRQVYGITPKKYQEQYRTSGNTF